MDPHPIQPHRDEENGDLLEFPLQERHRQIISAFMAEHQRDSSPDSCGRRSWFPGSRGLQKLAGWLRNWRTQRKESSLPSSAPPQE